MTVVNKVIMYEDWDERPDGIYYKWKFEGEESWHEKLTAYTEKPYIQMKYLTKEELVHLGLEAPDLNKSNKSSGEN